ncbi:MAG: aminoglycoside phosphotransferase [Rhodobacteraceae bacterium]|nr:aminoglycoside phosphotransferase [Paracoccaceae bacterium]
MTGLYDDAFVERLRAGAQGLAGRWGLGPETEVSLLTLSENATFLARDPAALAPVILRVHRPDYHTRAEIESELAWINALRSSATVDTPEPLVLEDGGHIAEFMDGAQLRHVVGFRFMTGSEPDETGDLVPGFETLGAISARLHGQARSWQPPQGFTRKTWTWDTAFGPAPLWGDWRAALGLTEDGRVVLERLADTLRVRLEAYGQGPDRFGLVHADLRLANLLVDGDRLGVIDFDDCGTSWFAYDFAAAISFLETEPYIPDLQAAWLRGYRTVAPFAPEHEAMLPTFILFRRLLLTAWIASHAETETAAWAGMEAFTEGTIRLAETYLASEPA